MTRAQRWLKKMKDAEAQQPRVHFTDTEVFAIFDGVCFVKGSNTVCIDLARIPALVKFLKENFVRRDK